MTSSCAGIAARDDDGRRARVHRDRVRLAQTGWVRQARAGRAPVMSSSDELVAVRERHPEPLAPRVERHPVRRARHRRRRRQLGRAADRKAEDRVAVGVGDPGAIARATTWVGPAPAGAVPSDSRVARRRPQDPLGDSDDDNTVAARPRAHPAGRGVERRLDLVAVEDRDRVAELVADERAAPAATAASWGWSPTAIVRAVPPSRGHLDRARRTARSGPAPDRPGRRGEVAPGRGKRRRGATTRPSSRSAIVSAEGVRVITAARPVRPSTTRPSGSSPIANTRPAGASVSRRRDRRLGRGREPARRRRSPRRRSSPAQPHDGHDQAAPRPRRAPRRHGRSASRAQSARPRRASSIVSKSRTGSSSATRRPSSPRRCALGGSPCARTLIGTPSKTGPVSGPEADRPVAAVGRRAEHGVDAVARELADRRVDRPRSSAAGVSMPISSAGPPHRRRTPPRAGRRGRRRPGRSTSNPSGSQAPGSPSRARTRRRAALARAAASVSASAASASVAASCGDSGGVSRVLLKPARGCLAITIERDRPRVESAHRSALAMSRDGAGRPAQRCR